MTRWTPERREELRAAWLPDTDLAELAVRFGTTPEGIRKVGQRMRLSTTGLRHKPRVRPEPLPLLPDLAALIERIRAARAAHVGFVAIARREELTPGQVAGYCRRHGLTQPRNARPTGAVADVAGQMWKRGATCPEIDRALKLHAGGADSMRQYDRWPKKAAPAREPPPARAPREVARPVQPEAPKPAALPVLTYATTNSSRAAVRPRRLDMLASGCATHQWAPERKCQWPTSSGRPWRFCEAPVTVAGAYCCEHRARAYVAHSVARHAAAEMPA